MSSLNILFNAVRLVKPSCLKYTFTIITSNFIIIANHIQANPYIVSIMTEITRVPWQY